MALKRKKDNGIEMEQIKELLVFSAIAHQQNNYELLSDWNEYDSQNPHILKNCIGISLFGPPKADKNESCTSMVDASFLYEEIEMKKIEKVYNKILEHGIQNTKDRKILCGLLYNIIITKETMKVVDDKIKKGDNFNGDTLMQYVQPIPIFKVLKNIKEKAKPNTIKLEVHYIDCNARVYKSWTDYLTTNILPPCIMVVPHDGAYQGKEEKQWTDEMSYIWTDVHMSPASKKKLLNVVDITSSLIGLGGLGVSVAALFNPIGASVAAAGAIGMGVSSLWTIGKSSHELVDRSRHDQSISPINKDGFACWLGIVGSGLAVVSTGGSFLLSKAIKNGTTITKLTQRAHDTVQISTLVVSGCGTGLSAYNIYDNYKESKTVSYQDILNLTANLLLLGNSVISLKLSKTIIENQQTSIIKDYEASLRSNRHRKEFQKMIRNTKTTISDPTKLNQQIIRSINQINNKDEFFASILRNRKSFASKGIKPDFVGGEVTVDGNTLMNPVDFVKSMTKTETSAYLTAVKPTIEPKPFSALIPNEIIFENIFALFLNYYATELANFLIPKLQQFVFVLTDLNEYDEPGVMFFKLLKLSLKIIKVMVEQEYPGSNLLVEAVSFLWDFIKANIREALSEICGKGPREYRETVMKVLISLYEMIEKNLDEWVNSFKEYLRIKVRKLEVECKKNCSIS